MNFKSNQSYFSNFMIPEAPQGRDNRSLSESSHFGSFGAQNDMPESYLVNLVRTNPERFLEMLMPFQR